MQIRRLPNRMRLGKCPHHFELKAHGQALMVCKVMDTICLVSALATAWEGQSDRVVGVESMRDLTQSGWWVENQARVE